MSAQRRGLVDELIEAIGVNTCRIVSAGNGWPTRVRMRVGDEDRLLDLYVSLVGSHARRDYERRFQNPAEVSQRLISRYGVAVPLLVGVDRRPDGTIIAVIPDTDRRVGNTNRFSVLFRRELLHDASNKHWAEYNSSSGEVITAIDPKLLPYFVMLQNEDIVVPLGELRTAIGDTVADDGIIGEISRKAVMRVVRDARFRKKIITAYSGRCVLCGINWGLIQAAHIYPISAPQSSDAIANGLGLCGNHHSLFDAHKLHVDPSTLEVSFDRELLVNAGPAGTNFLNGTRNRVEFPTGVNVRNSKEWLEKRYDWYDNKYEWVV